MFQWFFTMLHSRHLLSGLYLQIAISMKYLRIIMVGKTISVQSFNSNNYSWKSLRSWNAHFIRHRSSIMPHTSFHFLKYCQMLVLSLHLQTSILQTSRSTHYLLARGSSSFKTYVFYNETILIQSTLKLRSTATVWMPWI